MQHVWCINWKIRILCIDMLHFLYMTELPPFRGGSIIIASDIITSQCARISFLLTLVSQRFESIARYQR